MPRKSNNFYDVVSAAVEDMTRSGFDSQSRILEWEKKLRDAAASLMRPQAQMEAMLRNALADVYSKMLKKGKLFKYHPGVSRFTIERLQPQMRAELDRRIVASANLIRLNREKSIQTTLQRFSGWATSIPKGGSEANKKSDTTKDIRKALVRLPFEERRVLIDQGHKLTAAINEIVAKDANALALIWHSHWRQSGYNYRPDHKERDQRVYAIRPNWALDKGLMKAGPAGYYDKVTSVGEEPFCRCYAQYIYNLRDLPADMLTQKGASELARVRKELAA